MTNNSIILDITPYHINFDNGYYNVKTHEFCPRTIDYEYKITKYITRNYVKSSQNNRDYYMSVIIKIYPEIKDRNLILTKIASALSWQSIKSQDSLFLIGCGSSGKSTMLTHLEIALNSCYFQEMKSDMLSNEKTSDKILNSYSSNPILLTWINEMDTKIIDSSIYKNLVDGVINTTKLYQENSHKQKIYSLVVATSNSIPNFNIDSGISRRIIGYEHTTKFVKDINDPAINNKTIFYGDSNLTEKIENSQELQNAIFDIYADYCYNWIKNGQKIDFSKSINFKNTTSIITGSSDDIQDFIDKNIEVTNDCKDRISKTELLESFKSVYPKKFMSIKILISGLKDRGIQYNPTYRYQGLKGCFTGIKFSSCEISDNDNDDIEFGIEKNDQLDKIKYYEEQLQILYKLQIEKTCIKSNKIVKNKIERIIKPTIVKVEKVENVIIEKVENVIIAKVQNKIISEDDDSAIDFDFDEYFR